VRAHYRYICDRIRAIIKLDAPPHKLAAAFALGVFIAFSPWLGLHIVSAIALAWLFRLSRVVVLTASFLNNPWTIVPMYSFCLWFGFTITGSDAAIPEIAWRSLGVRELYHVLLPFLWPYVAGTLVIGAIAAAISYFVIYGAVVRYRKLEGKVLPKVE
jgi:uncharacterized protein